jgi:hypothetical protein
VNDINGWFSLKMTEATKEAIADWSVGNMAVRQLMGMLLKVGKNHCFI